MVGVAASEEGGVVHYVIQLVERHPLVPTGLQSSRARVGFIELLRKASEQVHHAQLGFGMRMIGRGIDQHRTPFPIREVVPGPQIPVNQGGRRVAREERIHSGREAIEDAGLPRRDASAFDHESGLVQNPMLHIERRPVRRARIRLERRPAVGIEVEAEGLGIGSVKLRQSFGDLLLVVGGWAAARNILEEQEARTIRLWVGVAEHPGDAQDGGRLFEQLQRPSLGRKPASRRVGLRLDEELASRRVQPASLVDVAPGKGRRAADFDGCAREPLQGLEDPLIMLTHSTPRTEWVVVRTGPGGHARAGRTTLDMTTIAFLGLGAMGARMAARLLEGGHTLRVYNRSPEAATALNDLGAITTSSPREAATGAEVVVSMVTDDGAARSVWLHPETGALRGMSQGAIAVESSTVTPEWIVHLGESCDDANISLLDAPVIGSRPQADAGQLIFTVGGPAPTLETVRNVLSSMGSTIHHVGARGSGARLKLVVNALFGIQVAALSELLGYTAKSGLEPAHVVEILGQIPVTSPAMKGIGGLIVAKKFDPMFPIDLVAKDFGYAVDSASAVGASTPVTTATRDVYVAAQNEGLGPSNIAGVAKRYVD